MVFIHFHTDFCPMVKKAKKITKERNPNRNSGLFEFSVLYSESWKARIRRWLFLIHFFFRAHFQVLCVPVFLWFDGIIYEITPLQFGFLYHPYWWRQSIESTTWVFFEKRYIIQIAEPSSSSHCLTMALYPAISWEKETFEVGCVLIPNSTALPGWLGRFVLYGVVKSTKSDVKSTNQKCFNRYHLLKGRISV